MPKYLVTKRTDDYGGVIGYDNIPLTDEQAETISVLDQAVAVLRRRRDELIKEFNLPVRERYQVVMVDSEEWELD